MRERIGHTFDPSRRDILGAVPLEVLPGELEPMARVVGRVGDDGLYVGDVLRQVDAPEEFDVDIVEFEGVDGGECVAAKDVSNHYEMSREEHTSWRRIRTLPFHHCCSP